MSVSTMSAIGVFCLMQAIAQVLFKWGSVSDDRWLWGFLFGNLFGFSSIWLLMFVYKFINPNIALGICGGGSFLLSQVVLSLVFKTEISLTQWGGIMAIVVGMILLATGKWGTI